MLLIVGLALGLVPSSVSDQPPGVATGFSSRPLVCGSPWAPQAPHYADATAQGLRNVPTDARAWCTDAFGARGTLAVVALALGAVALLALLLSALFRPAPTAAPGEPGEPAA